LREARAELLRAWRTPAFAAPTLLLPLAFYTLFAIILAPAGSGTAAYSLATYGVYVALAPCLYGFGATIAADRDSGILGLKQVSPLPVTAFLVAKLSAALVFTAVELLALYLLAAWGAGVSLPVAGWVGMTLAHLASVLPFCLLGLCVGLRTSNSAAMALTNVLFFGLAILGGLWIPLFVFPHAMQIFALLLPSSHLAALALAAAGQPAGVPAVHGLVLVGFVAALSVLARKSWTEAQR
jgi:ABC-2 type transport system permease protein